MTTYAKLTTDEVGRRLTANYLLGHVAMANDLEERFRKQSGDAFAAGRDETAKW